MEPSKAVFCRFCVKPKQSSKLFNLEMDKKKCKDVIQKLNSVSYTIDLTSFLPKTICSTCYHSLTKAYMFMQKVEESQKILNNIYLESDLKQDIKQESSDGIDSIENSCDPDSFKSPKHEVKDDKDDIKLYEGENNVVPKSKLNEKTWDTYIWSCKFCMENLSTVSELRTHCKQSHNACNGFKCIECNEECDSFSKFTKHVGSHHQHLKKCCPYCNDQITGSRKQHISTHITPPNTVCDSCGGIQPNSEALTIHQQLYKVAMKQENNDLHCHTCLKTFKSLKACRDHQKLHDNNRKRDYTCERCGKAFFSKSTLQGHMLTHDKMKPHACKICSKSFISISKLQAHVNVHSGAKPFTCEECGRGFRLKEQLKNHKIIHTNEMPFKCSDCGKSFRFRQIFANHKRQHTGYKPYSCDHCSMLFTNWSNYNKHMVSKHKTTMAKKKITPEGVFPINPLTGKIDAVEETVDTKEWRNKIMVPLKRGKKTL